MLINFMAARDFYNPTEYYIKKNGYIEVPKINLNFWCYANKKEADADENKRPSVYIKWVKTFKNIDEAINTEITAANNWGDNPTTLVTAKSGFSTYAAAYPVNYNEAGIDAYTVKLDKDKQEVTYTKFTGVVPAGKAVLVKGTPEQLYDLPVATESADETLFESDLQASDGTVTSNNSSYYVFATLNGKSGFKRLKDGLTLPNRKGYIVLTSNSPNYAKDFLDFNTETTSIHKVGTTNLAEEVSYNLAGQRVDNNYKGIVIKRGKVYINK